MLPYPYVRSAARCQPLASFGGRGGKFTTEAQRPRRSGGEVSIPLILTASPSLWFKKWKSGYPGLAPGYDEWSYDTNQAVITGLDPAYAVRKSASAD